MLHTVRCVQDAVLHNVQDAVLYIVYMTLCSAITVRQIRHERSTQVCTLSLITVRQVIRCAVSGTHLTMVSFGQLARWTINPTQPTPTMVSFGQLTL